MGYGDNEPPAMRVDAFPATLSRPNGFRVLILTFIVWDVIKVDVSAPGQATRKLEIETDTTATDLVFEPAKSGLAYTFTAQGCAKALDGSTGYCSPISKPLTCIAAKNTQSLSQFLWLSGADLRNPVALSEYVSLPLISLKKLMRLED